MCICKSNSSLDSDRTIEAMAAPISKKAFPFIIADQESDITVHEDETCFLLSIEMPDVHEKDLQITLQRNILTISGYRRNVSYACQEDDYDYNSGERRAPSGHGHKRTKRQRLSRQLEIDPNAIDIERAMASTWNGCYTLYAPKRRPQYTSMML